MDVPKFLLCISKNNSKENIVMNAECTCKAVFQLLIHFPIAKWSGGARVDIWLENTCMAGWFGHGWQETPPCFENFAWCVSFSCTYGGLAWSDLWTSGIKGETIYWSDFRTGLLSLRGVSISILIDQRVSQELWDLTAFQAYTSDTEAGYLSPSQLFHISQKCDIPLPWPDNLFAFLINMSSVAGK